MTMALDSEVVAARAVQPGHRDALKRLGQIILRFRGSGRRTCSS